MTVLWHVNIGYVSDIHQTSETDEENPNPIPCPNDRFQM